jgi:hypothetical protein
MSDRTNSTMREPSRIPEKPRQPYLTTVLFFLPFFSALMLGAALLNLFGGNGDLIDHLKIGVITIAAFVVSYTVYRLAIEKGAPLAAHGIKSAGAISLASILIVGAGLWMGTYPGLVSNGVEERGLYQFENESVRFIEEASAEAAKAARLVPVMASISGDFTAKVTCEKAANCVSLTGGGGYGPVAKTLENLAARSIAIGLEAASGLTRRDEILDKLESLTASMQATLADENKSIGERRSALRKIDAQVGQTLKRLEEAVPVALLSAYATELRSGITIPNRPDVTARINGFLAGYAQTIDDVLASIGKSQAAHPEFPPRVGASDTLSYLGEYAPLAILTFAVELVFPLALWGYTLLTLLWERYRDDPDDEPRGPDPSVFEQLTNRPVDQLPPPQKSLPQYPPPRSSNPRHRNHNGNRRNGR